MGLHSSSPTVLFSLSELDVNKVVDHIDALIKAKRTAVKAQVVIPGVYPFPAGVRLVVCGALPVNGSDCLECLPAVGYSLDICGVLHTVLLVGVDEHGNAVLQSDGGPRTCPR